jgi:hypothetical protein
MEVISILLFILTWIGLYCLVIIAMFTDNLCWISSSPEFNEVKKKSFKDYLIYCFRDRIFAVIKDTRDIIPAVLTSFCLTFALRINLFIGIILLISIVISTIIIVRFMSARDW